MNSVSTIIASNLKLFSPQNYGSWNKVYCEVCGDGSRTKGPRGGWLLEDSSAAYNCFNCGINATFDTTREWPYSRDMRNVLKSFNVDIKELDKLIVQNSSTPKTIPKHVKSNFNDLTIPDHFYALSDAMDSNEFALQCVDHIRSYRNLDLALSNFYLSTGKSSDPKHKHLAPIYKNRLIIPCMYRGKMIFYQGYDVLKQSTKKYISCDSPKNGAIYNCDQIDIQDSKRPIFILEGMFDAMHVNGIAIMQNSMTKDQIDLINKNQRKKVLIPDRNTDSKKLMEQAIDNEWFVAFPKYGTAKDVDEAVRKYGKIYTLHSINSSIKSYQAAKMLFKSF